mmetsp:Transcript_35343/g.46661  ORF Transcript_35343/g.46661 Transcript_35343/m.46661 type:complete len:102 (+) Transcript_35343:2700-3005(+)
MVKVLPGSFSAQREVWKGNCTQSLHCGGEQTAAYCFAGAQTAHSANVRVRNKDSDFDSRAEEVLHKHPESQNGKQKLHPNASFSEVLSEKVLQWLQSEAER